MNFWHTLKKPIIALAPMAGYTDSVFRLICKQMGADVVYTEMISVDAIVFKNKKTLAMLHYDQRETPLVFQLFGSKPEHFKQAIDIINKSMITHYSPLIPLGIDINFGCPARKVLKTGSGAALMNELDKAKKIIKTVCENTSLPVSVKIRAKVKDTTAVDFAKKIKDLPFSAIMIHGRTLKQGFAGEIDFGMIKKIKQILPDKIVLANGGINSHEDAKLTLDKTGADGLGIGRGALGNPWLFKSIKKNERVNQDWQDVKKIILRHAKLFLKDNHNLIPLRHHLVHYTKGQKNASAMRQRLIQVKTLNDLKKILLLAPDFYL